MKILKKILCGFVIVSMKALKQCQEIRLNRLQKECRLFRANRIPPLSAMNHTELKEIKGLVDDEHRFILKAIAKTGCTSWKTILFNNSRGVNLKKPPRHIHTKYKNYGMHMLKEEPSRNEILRKLDEYFVMLNVRHPLQRVESVFKEKILPSRKKRRNYRGSIDHQVLFGLFLDRILKNSTVTKMDQHVQPYVHQHVCLLNISYISKIETAAQDMAYIIRTRLSNKGGPVALHSTGNSAVPKTVMHLPYFSSVEYIKRFKDTLDKLYGMDFRAFGYNYSINKSTGEILGYCNNVINGMCC